MFRARFVQLIRRASTTRPPPLRQWIGYMAAGVTIGAAGVLLLNRPPVAAVIAEKSDLLSLAVNDLTVPKYADEGQFRHAVALMTQVVGEDDVSTDSGELSSHNDSFFATHHPPNPEQQRPLVVLYPETTEEVAKIVAIAHEHRVPVVASLGLTSLEGQMMHTRGPRSVAISFLKHMNEVVAFHPDDLDVVVQPGVGWKELDDWLLDHEEGKHLMFGPDPGIGAAIGGMVSTLALGTNAYRYGTMKEAVVNMTVVLADGLVIRTKQRPRKSSAGYDLTHLFIGAEGTLGIVTEITLKLHVRPVHEYVLIALFPTIKDAAATAQQVISKSGLHPNAIEILNEEMMMFVNHSGTTTKKFEERPTLFFKLGGPSRENVDEQVKIIRDIAKSNHLCLWETLTSAEDNDLLWLARRQGLWSTIDYGRKVLPDPDDVQVWTTDIAVPILRLAQVIDETDADLKVEFPKKVSVMGHIGDGNCHFLIVYNTPEHAKALAAVDRMVARALKYEGTCTGEHGVGVGKRKYLPVEYGEPAMGLMRALKVGLDKRRILNPDKIVTIDPEDDLDAQLDGHKDWGCCQ